MVHIEKESGNFVFEVQGMHKVWALKSRLTIPAAHIANVYTATDEMKNFFAFRMMGTRIPGLITAGSFVAQEGCIFCDIMHRDKCIVVELRDEHYDKLVIEVEDVQEAIAMLMVK